MIRAIVSASVAIAATTNTNVTSIGCDICTFALQKAFDLGCGAGAAALSAICLDAEPACLAAFEELCSVCDSDCNLGCWSQWACAHVDLCPSTTCAIEHINLETNITSQPSTTSNHNTYYQYNPTTSTRHPSDPTTGTVIEEKTKPSKKFLRRG